jgi:hypothetical protein
MLSSYALLQGHISDFYNYNKVVVGGNNYLPIIYAIFAIWNTPIFLLGLTSDPTSGLMTLNPYEIVWAKLLLTAFFFGTVYLLYKCSILLTPNEQNKSTLYPSLFATSPIAIFAVFIFSQYDIIGTFFSVFAFYFYLKRKLTMAALIFSLAISFKFFALVIYLPLLFLAEKNVLKITILLLIGALFTSLQFLFYWNSQAFQAGVLAIPSGKAEGLSLNNNFLFNPKLYYIISYFFVCAYAYFSRLNNDQAFFKHAIFIPIASYSLMFSSVVWHPQWLIILMPFFCLSYLFIKNHKLFYTIDAIGMLSFIWICVNQWVNNVDASMLSRGLFGSYFTYFPILISDLFPPKYLNFFISIFRIYLFSPLIIIIIDNIAHYSSKNKHDNIFFYYIRFIFGISFFIIPSFFCAFIPISLATKISHEAYLVTLKKGLSLDIPSTTVGGIINNRLINQKFKAEENGLRAISLLFATYMRTNDTDIKISIKDSTGIILYQTYVNGRILKDNSYYSIYFPEVVYSKGKYYYIEISSSTVKSENAVTIWANYAPYSEGTLFINKTPFKGNLCFRLYYTKK